MPKLKCKVEQCMYNYDWLCSKNYIDVDGPGARNKTDTCCKSYEPKSSDNMNYEFATLGGITPNIMTEVYCDAVNCVFEKGQRCYADRIEIKNVSGKLEENVDKSLSSDVTNCQTFESKYE